MTYFPKFDDVFYQADDIHKMLLFPLLTIDLNTLKKGNGKVHFVSVYGNKNINNRYNIENLIGNDIIEFHWDGERYHCESDLSVIPNIDNIPEWYEEAVKKYEDECHTLKDCRNTNDINSDRDNYIRYIINYWIERDNYLKTNKISNNLNGFEFSIMHTDVISESDYIGRFQSQNDILDLFIDREKNKVYERFNFM